MNETIRVIVSILTLGISEIVKAAQDNKRCAWEYIYKPKSKTKCCKYRSKCALWTQCKEDAKSCKKAHNKNQDPCLAEIALPTEPTNTMKSDLQKQLG